MKAVIGQFYKDLSGAVKRIDQLKRLWKGRISFIAVGGDKTGWLVISESAARACGIEVPYITRRYKKLPQKLL